MTFVYFKLDISNSKKRSVKDLVDPHLRFLVLTSFAENVLMKAWRMSV